MLRVPGSETGPVPGQERRRRRPSRLLPARRPHASPAQNPDRQVVFFGIGFETTAPPNAMTVYQAKKLGIENFSLLVSHVRVPPAIEAIMTSPRLPGAGVPGRRARLHRDGDGRVPRSGRAVPRPDRGDRLRAARHPRGHPAHRAPARGRPGTRSRTPIRALVRPRATPWPSRCSQDVFEVVDRSWRGIGMIPQSGWRLSERYREYDAEHRFQVGDIHTAGVRRSAAAARCCRA